MLKIRNKYLIKNIFNTIKQNKFLEIVKYSKVMQNKLNMSIKDYIEYNQIEIEIIPVENIEYKTYFINEIGENEKQKKNSIFNIIKEGKIIKDKNKKFTKKNKDCFHIYFDNKKVQRRYLKLKENVSRIKIIIDYEIKSLKGLFKYCDCIKTINFIKFNRKNITDMSDMFYECTNLININLLNFNTSNVINMERMFYRCSSLKELNLSKFDTSKVINMSYMFSYCSSLNNLNISSFIINDNINVEYMFSDCLMDLKKKIKAQTKNLKDNAFIDFPKIDMWKCCCLPDLDFSFDLDLDDFTNTFHA